MKTYFDRVHTWGRVWSLSALCFLLCVPLAISAYLNAWPEASGVLKGLLAVVPLYWATAIIETVSYGPIIGNGGAYLAFVSGNISNLKIPCAIAALKNADLHPNSEEGEVVSTIAVATSAITTTILIAVGVLLFTPVLPLIMARDSYLSPAFEQVFPALFGSLAAGYFVKHWRVSFLPIVLGVLVLIFAPTLQVGVLIPVTVVASLVGAHLMFKRGLLGNQMPNIRH
ncbi:MAG: hypothetical protein LBB67_03170 [Oscillospiraceae bacterium]|jgi:hypothetical protein|nr:hypothetical protein [Oscillospiraceae bacterium]